MLSYYDMTSVSVIEEFSAQDPARLSLTTPHGEEV